LNTPIILTGLPSSTWRICGSTKNSREVDSWQTRYAGQFPSHNARGGGLGSVPLASRRHIGPAMAV